MLGIAVAPEDAKELGMRRGPRKLQQGTVQTTALLLRHLGAVLTVLQGLQRIQPRGLTGSPLKWG